MKNLRFQFIIVFIAKFANVFTRQYALSSNIILIDESNYFKTVPYFTRDYRSEIQEYLNEVPNKKAPCFTFTYNERKFEIIYSPILLEERFITNQSCFWDKSNKDRFIRQLCKSLKQNCLSPKTLPKFIIKVKMVPFNEEKEYYGYLLGPLLMLIEENNQYIKDPLIEKDNEEEKEYPLNPNNIEHQESFTYENHNLRIIFLKDSIYNDNIPKTSRYNLDDNLNTLIEEKCVKYNINPYNLEKIPIHIDPNKVHIFLLNDDLMQQKNERDINTFALNHQTIILDKNKYFDASILIKENYELGENNISHWLTFNYKLYKFEIIILKNPALWLPLTNDSCLPKELILQINDLIEFETQDKSIIDYMLFFTKKLFKKYVLILFK